MLSIIENSRSDKVTAMNQETGQTRRKRLRVLVADDTATIRESLSALIARVDDVEIVGQACTGREALEMIRALKPDMVTLDIRMPEMTGIKVLEAVKREQLKVGVIVLTGLTEVEYRRKCLELGALYFLHKSTEFETVMEVLTEHAERLNGAGNASRAEF